MKSVEELLSLLTLEEKIALVAGHNFMFTNSVNRLGIKPIRMSDGPHGLRVQNGNGDNGVTGSMPSTCFPTASCLANTFNPTLANKMGEAIGIEANYYNIDILLGPGVCIKRNPLCGRNFEYFSEDPYLVSVLGSEQVKGLQSRNVGACLKHFALNNTENYRFMGDSIVDKRVIREIYLRQYEWIIKNSKPDSIMAAYNKINGIYCSENKWLLNDFLKEELHYDGLVMTDWGGSNNRVLSIKSGLDLEMPGDTLINRKWLFDAINNKTLDIKDLDKAVRNVLNLVIKHENKIKVKEVDWLKHHELAKNIALEGAVLLKNKNNVLPLNKEDKYLIIGELFEKMRYQGSGSSMINPYYHTSIKEMFDKNNINYEYKKGYVESDNNVNKALIEEAILKSKEHNNILLFIGLTDYEESEGKDRDSMSLPINQLALVNRLIKENKKIVIVLFGGGVIELPFYDEVEGILDMFLSGQNGGSAAYELLFGIKNPSGRLAETWPLTYKDVPFGDTFSKTKQEIYKESIFVGYRYYMTKGKKVRFPFGYGLSYTDFKYNNLNVKKNNNDLIINVDVTNIGKVLGDEVIQVYFGHKSSKMFTPIRELKGFTKVSLLPKETKTVEVIINIDNLKSWAIKEDRFILENGEYDIQICKNADDVILSKSIILEGEEIDSQYNKTVQKAYENLDFDNINDDLFTIMSNIKIPMLPSVKPITLESRMSELNNTFIGKILYNAIISVAKNDLKKAKKMPDGVEKENKIKGAIFLKRILDTNSIRTMSMSAGKSLPYNIACGLRDLSNGHIIKGLKNIFTKIKAPKLPDEEVK